MDEKWQQLKDWINESDNIVFFGGAGVSTESGIPDFRSVDGLYNQKYKYPPERIISHSFYIQNPEEFYRFYKDRMLFPDAKPNAAHKALAKLEQEGKLKAVITQNIDGLHQMAGSKEVLELHGSVHRNYCTRCGQFYDLDYVRNSEGVPTCTCGGRIKSFMRKDWMTGLSRSPLIISATRTCLLSEVRPLWSIRQPVLLTITEATSWF